VIQGDISIEALDVSVSVSEEIAQLVEDAVTAVIEEPLETSTDDLSAAVEVIEEEHHELVENLIDAVTEAEQSVAADLVDAYVNGDVSVHTSEDGSTEVVVTGDFQDTVQETLDDLKDTLVDAGYTEESADEVVA
jgi:predicted RNase H-like nuclease